MSPGLRLAAWPAIVMALLGLTGAGAAEGPARLLAVHGPVVLQKRRGGDWTRLTPLDQGRVLRTGWTIRCRPGGAATLLLGTERVPLPNPRDGAQYTIQAMGAAPAVSPEVQNLRREYTRIGGVRPAAITPFYSPAPDSRVSPARLILRWIPRRRGELISLAVAAASGAGDETPRPEVWRLDGVDGGQGELRSATLRQALEKFRREGGQGPLQLILADLSGSQTTATFSLLTTVEEAALDAQLARVDREAAPPLARHVRRAAAFTQCRLYPEAAQELDAALAAAPGDTDLLVTAILAHRRTGNTRREAALTRRLPPGVPVPG